MGEAVIHTQDLTFRCGDNTAVNALSPSVERGAVFACLGHNGAGKTTTVRLLNGVLHPASGDLRVPGLDPCGEGPALRKRTGVLTETPSLDEYLTARQNLHYTANFSACNHPVSNRASPPCSRVFVWLIAPTRRLAVTARA
ncbi:MAG: ATP-binding cassette domain-containing protein [Chloroflexota bacterium]